MHGILRLGLHLCANLYSNVTFQCHPRSNFIIIGQIYKENSKAIYDLLHVFHTNFDHTVHRL